MKKSIFVPYHRRQFLADVARGSVLSLLRKNLGWLSLLDSSLAPFHDAKAQDLTLVEAGVPKATIVVAAQTDNKVKTAAGELQNYIQKVSGAKIPIVSDDMNPSGSLILVGKSRLTGGIQVTIPSGFTNQRVEEGFVIVTQDNRLLLAGNDEGVYHGTEYAVYEFLNRLGVRWFMPGEFGEYVPHQSTIRVPKISVVETPDFIMRNWNTLMTGLEMEAEEKKWKMRNKMNPLWVDGMFMIPTDGCILNETLFKAHPELFALKADGTRDLRLQDLTSPKAFDLAVGIAKDYFRTHPGANSFGVAAGDGLPRDFSPETLKQSLDIREIMSHPGVPEELSISEEWFGFINHLTAEVRKEFPEVYIVTNGYANRDIPPQGIKLNDHVVLMFAAIWCCSLHALDDPHCWENIRQGEMIQRWCEVCSRVFLYGYNYQMLISGLTILPETRKLKHNFPLLKKWGVIGFADEARNIWAECGIASRYLRARLEWDANADVDAILDDFYKKWYGGAAKPMHGFYDALEDAIAKANVHLQEDRILPLVYNPTLMQTLAVCMAEAEKTVDSNHAKLHVQAERFIYEHLKQYVALAAAEERGDWADAVRHVDQMMVIRTKLNAINPFFIWPNETDDASGVLDWGVTYRSKYYQTLVDKTTGKTGNLVALFPQQALTQADLNEDGMFEQWYKPDWNDRGWQSVSTTRPYYFQGHTDNQGHEYDGYIWYRLSVDVPASAKNEKIMVYAPIVESEAWGWCNGEFIGHRKYQEAGLRPNFMELDATNFIKPGESNQFTFRVSTGFLRARAGAGFQSRLMLYTPYQGASEKKITTQGLLPQDVQPK